MERRDISVVGRVGVVSTTESKSGSGSGGGGGGGGGSGGGQKFSFGSATGGGFGSGLRVASSGGTLFSDDVEDDKDSSSSKEYEMIWSYCGMRLFGIDEKRLLQRLKNDERIHEDGRW